MSQKPDDQLAEAVAFARYAQVSVVCLGLDPSIEGELGDASNEYAAGDKHSLYLPESQRRLLKAVCDVSDQVVVVLLSGGALDLGEEEVRVNAVLQAWYPGAMGGKAVAEVLTGRVNPTGRLPVTFYYNELVNWDFEDYAMTGKTYRYFKEKPLYPFGYGLSYRKLTISELQEEAGGISYIAYNPHEQETEMIVQVYARFTEQGLRTANYQLVAVQPLCLQAGERRHVHIPLPDYWMQVVDEEGKRRPCRGRAVIYVGDHQPDVRSEELSSEPCLSIVLKK